jgi:flagellar biosynthesis protein FlhF
MVIKRYIVNNMNEAMTRIRYELGKDAVIISQRKIKKPGFWGFLRKKSIEVTAAVDSIKKPEEPEEKTNSEVMKELQQVKDALKEIKEGANRSSGIFNDNNSYRKESFGNKLRLLLENSDVSEKLIKHILSDEKTLNLRPEDMNGFLKSSIEKLIKISDSKMEGKVILVGPTGVGKTTTIAKLAGKLALIEKKKVGLITIDTYRIGAVEQLKSYAEIMNLPFKVVLSVKDMEAAVESMKDCEVILVDTTGRSSSNIMQISELRSFIEKVHADSVHLVISSTTKEKDVYAITEGYRQLNYNNVIVSKLDETTTFGSILNILDSAGQPLSFVTTGQNVPDDLRSITEAQISNLISGEGKL